jgi:hypothetical protein
LEHLEFVARDAKVRKRNDIVVFVWDDALVCNGLLFEKQTVQIANGSVKKPGVNGPVFLQIDKRVPDIRVHVEALSRVHKFRRRVCVAAHSCVVHLVGNHAGSSQSAPQSAPRRYFPVVTVIKIHFQVLRAQFINHGKHSANWSCTHDRVHFLLFFVFLSFEINNSFKRAALEKRRTKR